MGCQASLPCRPDCRHILGMVMLSRLLNARMKLSTKDEAEEMAWGPGRQVRPERYAIPIPPNEKWAALDL